MTKKNDNKQFPSTTNIAVSNEAIHAYYRMSNQEKKAFLCMVADIDSLNNDADVEINKLTGETVFSIREQPVKKFLKAINIYPERGDAVSALRKLAEGLMSRSIDLNSIQGKQSNKFKLVHFFELIEVTDETVRTLPDGTIDISKGEFKIRWQISKYLLPLYKNIHKNFTKLQLTEAIQLRNDYSIRFYEYFTEAWNKAHAIPGENIALEMTIEQLRLELDLDNKTAGVRSKAKPLFRDSEGKFIFKEFTRSCLKPAIAEIQERGFFTVSIKKKYTPGTHTTNSLIFTISKPIKGAVEGENAGTGIETLMYDEIVSMGVSKKSARILVKDYEHEYLRFAINTCRAKHAKDRKDNFAAYLFKAISSEWMQNEWNNEKARMVKINQKNTEKANQRNLTELLGKGEAIREADGSITPLSAEEVKANNDLSRRYQEKFDSLTEEEKDKLLILVKTKLTTVQLNGCKGMSCDKMWSMPHYKHLITSLLNLDE